MDATSSYFAKVVGATSADGEAARNAFVDSFAPFRHKISRLFDLAEFAGWTPASYDLPFFAQLYLTILVASADEDTSDIGNFRKRLAKVIGINSENLPLDGLADMWVFAAKWSKHEGRRGIRHLELPPPEHERRIGYSKRLAFPRFLDQRELERMLRTDGLDAASPVWSIVGAVQRASKKFSKSFMEEFERFLDSVRNADHKAALETSFWSAIADLTWRKAEDGEPRTIDDIALELNVDDPYDPLFSLVTRVSKPLADTFWKVRERTAPDREYRWELIPRAGHSGSLFETLRSPNARELLARSGLPSALRAECVAFRERDSGAWRSGGRLQTDEGFWLVAKSAKWRTMQFRLADLAIRPAYAVAIPGSEDWTLVGSLRLTETLRAIAEEMFPDSGSFALRLQPAAIHVSGVRHGEGYLFRPAVLPSVAVRDAQRVTCRVLQNAQVEQEKKGADSFELHETGSKGTFAFDPNASGLFEEPYTLELLARDKSGAPLAATTRRVYPECQSWHLKQPLDLSHSWVVGDQGQLIAAGGAVQSGDDVRPIDVDDHRLSFRPLDVAASLRFSEPRRGDPDILPGAWNDAIEIIAARFMRAAVIPSGELLDLLQRIFCVAPGRAWNILSDLIENRFIQQLYRRHWYGRVFCASTPSIVCYVGGEQVVGRIVGLAPRILRRNLAKLARLHGGELVSIISPDNQTIGALELSVSSRAALEEIAGAVNIPIVFKPVVTEELLPWQKILTTEGYDCSGDLAVWSESRKQFVPVEDAPDARPSLERHRPPSKQDTYKLLMEKWNWQTRSRDWALLARAAAAARFGTIDGTGSVSLSSTELTLPPLVSRGVVEWGGGVCFRDDTGCRVYPASGHWAPESVLGSWAARRAGDILTERLQLALRTRIGALATAALSRNRA